MIQPNQTSIDTQNPDMLSCSNDRTPDALGKRFMRAVLIPRITRLPAGERTSGNTRASVVHTLGGSSLELQVTEPTRETITTVQTIADNQHEGRVSWMEVVASQRSVDVTTGEVTEAVYPTPEKGSDMETLNPMAILGAVYKATKLHQAPTIE